MGRRERRGDANRKVMGTSEAVSAFLLTFFASPGWGPQLSHEWLGSFGGDIVRPRRLTPTLIFRHPTIIQHDISEVRPTCLCARVGSSSSFYYRQSFSDFLPTHIESSVNMQSYHSYGTMQSMLSAAGMGSQLIAILTAVTPPRPTRRSALIYSYSN